MTIKLGVIMDPIESINCKKDNTLSILFAAYKKGWQLYYLEQKDLYQNQNDIFGNMSPLIFKDNNCTKFSLGDTKNIPLSYLNVILMRKNPPFNMEYIYSTYFLEKAETTGTLIINSPRSIRDCNEKQFITHFPECIPPLLITRSKKQLLTFTEEQQEIVIKPLDGMGASSVFKTYYNDPNLNVIIDTLTNYEKTQVMAQKFIPDVSIGDKRILVIDGSPIPYALLRVAAAGEFRCNLAAGGTGKLVPLTSNDLRIINCIKPTLMKKGLMLVGLDIIGDYLTEINITSPLGIRELEAMTKIPIADMLIEAITKKLLLSTTCN